METAPQKPTYEELEQTVLVLKSELTQLRRLIFGQKSERFVPIQNADQLMMHMEGLEAQQKAIKTETISYTRRKPERPNVTPHGRNPIPPHLPRVDKVIEPEQDTTGCKRIGEEVTETLEYKKAELYVLRTIRPKYAMPSNAGVIIADLPSMSIPRGGAGASLLAHLLVSKYVDHLPFYRLRQQFKRTDKVDLPASTLDGWFKAAVDLVMPLGERMREMISNSAYLQVDETPIRVQDPMLKGKCHQGFMWAYLDPVQRLCVFDYRPSRGHKGPADVLDRFSGALQVDGWTAYDQFDGRPDVVMLACFAHARRYFEKAKEQDPERAAWMLTTIQKLYEIERTAREQKLSAEHRFELRQKESKSILDEIKAWLKDNAIQVLPASLIGKAINYTVGQWPRLERYINDGQFEIDNNLVENAIRPIALGRKNYLFAGSHEAAGRAAMVYSLMATAKHHNINPTEYLEFVLSKISDFPYRQVSDLLPQNWKAKFTS